MPQSLFVAACDTAGTVVGCGAYRPLDDAAAELKRMFAVPETKGVGTALLAYLEARAFEDGYRAMWLETRFANAHAHRFYQEHGYAQIPNFGKYIGNAEAGALLDPLSDAADRVLPQSASSEKIHS